MKLTNALLLLVFLCPLLSFAQLTDLKPEEQAIMDVINEETRAYFERDLEAWKTTYVQTDYFHQHSFWEGWDQPVKLVSGWDAKLESSTFQFDQDRDKDVWDSSKYEKSKLNIRIAESGDMAWVTFEEKVRKEGSSEKVAEAIGTRIMEKHNGQWKIAYLGYLYYPAKEKNLRNY